MSELESKLQSGYTQFYDYDEPGLPAGNYEIAVTLALPNTVTKEFTQTVTQSFVAQGPQFSLDTAEIHSIFPAANANGDFSQILPNLLMKNSKLPWERLLTADPGVPWMALLVLTDQEMPLNPATNSPLISSSVADFLTPLAGVVKPGIPAAHLAPTVLASSMNSILISTEVFQAVSPRLVELASLAHVREVDPEHQAAGELGADAWYSVLIANRFPESATAKQVAGAVNYVHLVSLEGLSEYLVDTPAWPSGTQSVQLVSLANWRFVSTRQAGQTFADLAQNLILSAATDPTQLLLKIPVVADASAAATRLAQGYTALNYQTLPGSSTFAWYRGPFSPVRPQPLPAATGNYRHPSQVEIYDQANGVFDQSYAAAWTIGRLAALSDPEFIDSLQRVRARTLLTGRRLLERAKMPHLAGLSLEELAAPGVTRKYWGRSVAAGMGAKLTALLNGPPHAQPVALPPRYHKPRTNFLLADQPAPQNPAAELKWFLGHAQVANFLTAQAAENLAPMAEWLAKLVLLYNIPFNHLVPDQRMLPTESIRFFYVDQGWLTALADAAMTIGVHGTRDTAVHDLLGPELWRQARLKVPTVRRKLLRRAALPAQSDPALPPMPAAGMLLRSELLVGWPGLQIIASAAGATVNALRIDQLAPNVLLVLWDQAPDTVTLSQPQQGLTFGVENQLIALRSLATANLGQQTGSFFPASGNISQFYRTLVGKVGQQVLQLVPSVAGTVGYLLPALQQVLGQRQRLSPAQFAIQMLNAPQQITFHPPHSNL